MGVLLVPVVLGPPARSQPDPQDAAALAALGAALEDGDSGRLLDGACERVELSLFGQGARYSRGQAALVLRDFFRRFPPMRVQLSEPSVVDDGRAAMGRYWTDEGNPLGIYIRLEREGDDWLLAVLRVDRPALYRVNGR